MHSYQSHLSPFRIYSFNIRNPITFSRGNKKDHQKMLWVYGLWNKTKGHLKGAWCLHEAVSPPSVFSQMQEEARLGLSPSHHLSLSLSLALSLSLSLSLSGSLPTWAEARLSDWKRSTSAPYNPALHAHLHRETTAKPVVADQEGIEAFFFFVSLQWSIVP